MVYFTGVTMGKILKKISRFAGFKSAPEAKPTDREFLERMRELFELASEAEKEQRERELECLRMCDPKQQWDEADRSAREADGRPCLTEDGINPFVLQICNSLRQNRAAVTVNPVDDKSDPDTAEVLQGLIRHITYDSSADMAYDSASTSCVRTGRGFYRVITEYESEDSFDQVIKVKVVPNTHMVRVDPASIEPDYSDADWFMICEDMFVEEFKRLYTGCDSAQMSRSQWESIGDDAPGWYDGDFVRIVEVFYKDRKKKKIARLSTGDIVDVKDIQLPEGVKAKEGVDLGGGIIIDAIRDVDSVEVKWAKFNSVEVLEENVWPGKIIPIIPVLGKELTIGGTRRYFGLVDPMIDPQKRFNWMLSSQAEIISLVPRAPWIATEDSLVNPNAWANSHNRTVGVLYHKSQVDGQPVSAPQRSHSSADISSVNQALLNASEGLKKTTGLYNPSIGAASSSQSGVAIRAQQSQGDMSTYHFQDAITRARRKEGRIFLELIPKIYDTKRALRIIGDDDSESVVTVNGEKDGQEKLHDLTVGKYDITVTSGPSYTTRRQENLSVLLNMAQTLPSISQLAPDLIVSQMDIPIAKPLAERLKMGLPPGVAKDDKSSKQLPPEIHNQIQQSQQMIEKLTVALNQARDENDSKIADLKTKIKIAEIQADAQIRAAFIRAESAQQGADGRALLEHGRMMADIVSQPLAGAVGEVEEDEQQAGQMAGNQEVQDE